MKPREEAEARIVEIFFNSLSDQQRKDVLLMLIQPLPTVALISTLNQIVGLANKEPL